MANTTIYISGQIHGNSHLLAKMSGYTDYKKTMFNGYAVYFKTKMDAVKSIRDAYNSMIDDEPERKNRIGGIKVNKDRTELYYDASKAIIS